MRRLGIPLLTSLFFWGCLIEQPIEEDSDEGPSRNHPPSIVLRSPNASVLYLQRSCEPIFSLHQIEDFDLHDDLEVRWFVNYEDGDDPTPLDRWFIPASRAEGPLRFTGDRGLKVNLEDYPHSTVVVEAVVSDGFADPAEPPRHRAVARGRGQDVATWTIVISEGSWCNL